MRSVECTQDHAPPITGIPPDGLDTADGEAPVRRDVFARSKTDCFFLEGDFTFACARLSLFLAFHRFLALRCFLATFRALLFGISLAP